jgi:hypothetical protein
MDHAILLDAGTVSHPDVGDVGPQNSSGPDKAFAANRHRSDEDRLRMHVGIGGDGGLEILECVKSHFSSLRTRITHQGCAFNQKGRALNRMKKSPYGILWRVSKNVLFKRLLRKT